MAEVNLKDVVEKLKEFLREEHLTSTERIECNQMLDWLGHYHDIITTTAPALVVACTALRRMVDKAELGEEANTSAAKHHANRLNKLIGNLEELVELESKQCRAT